jgi:GSCFA family protein
MPKLAGKLGTWELPHVHMWKDRSRDILFTPTPIISSTSRIATIGSCFAAELASAMKRLHLIGDMHPKGLFYTSRSIRQEMERIFPGPRPCVRLPNRRTKAGWIDPLGDHHRPFATEAELNAWTDTLDRKARELFQSCDIAIITLGLIEAWRDPGTGAFYPQIPHPEMFASSGATFHRLTVSEILDDLDAVTGLIRANTKAKIILTVSPVPLHATMTRFDVRVGNTESKSRIRAAVSEFVERHPDVHYFHSYEMVVTAERQSDFMQQDGRHVERQAVDYILNTFLRMFACPDVSVPAVDVDWLTVPTKTAARAQRRPLSERLIGRLHRLADRLS